MREPAGIEAFYGDAIRELRRRRKWSVRRLAREAHISPGSLLDYEHGRTIPPPQRRRRIACALDVTPEELDRVAASLRRSLAGLGTGADRLAARVAAEMADGFEPLAARLAAAEAPAPRAAPEEKIRALAPVVADLSLQDLEELVSEFPSLHCWAFVKLVGEESARAASVDARRGLELASFALGVAGQVSGDEGWVCRVFGWAIMSNARRVGSELAEAEEALACSARLQADPPEGRPELPEPWRLLDLEASLRIELRQLPQALRLLDQAAELAPRSGPVRAHLLCIRSIALNRMGDLEGSIAALREGLAGIASETEPRLYCMLQFNLADCLTGVGKAAEAEEMLPTLRRLQAQIGNGLNQIRLRWLEGKINAGLGRLDRAIEALSRVLDAFNKEGVHYDEAQAGMDLARLYLLKGWTAEVKRLVFKMAPVFKSKKVHVEAQKALALFRRAVEMETATPELAGRVAGYLRRAEHDPELVFEEAA
ncbi:MAG TPA: helix-turn-helix transcriptional regulator [Thermoanaerobaculia bacterium]|jgi:transcriptional regulator with XRE-family HTH domain|nr:helix-turn-helix transcriptional regulator [Thermoanaerobaculia bacterium]